jgi:predicted RNase H-like HicB family nuclease
MQTAKYLHWQEEEMFIGYFLDYPDYWMQGETPDDLKDHLRALCRDILTLELV